MKSLHYIFKAAFAAVFFFLTPSFSDAQSLPDSLLKRNIQPIAQSLQSVTKLQPMSFEYKTEANKDFKLPAGKQYGFLADEVEQVLPEVVKRRKITVPFGKNSFRTKTISEVEVNSLIPILVSAMKEQQLEIERLKQEVQDLQGRVPAK